MGAASHSDVLILGGGPGGHACALRARQLGLSVTLIEADRVGGTCSHRGCIPTKALLRAAEVADIARLAASREIPGIPTGGRIMSRGQAAGPGPQRSPRPQSLWIGGL